MVINRFAMVDVTVRSVVWCKIVHCLLMSLNFDKICFVYKMASKKVVVKIVLWVLLHISFTLLADKYHRSIPLYFFTEYDLNYLTSSVLYNKYIGCY